MRIRSPYRLHIYCSQRPINKSDLVSYIKTMSFMTKIPSFSEPTETVQPTFTFCYFKFVSLSVAQSEKSTEDNAHVMDSRI